MTKKYNSCVFNFSSSHFGGGLKRILAYLEWFNENGGANFVLNEKLRKIAKVFPKNQYCFLEQNPFNKVLNYYRNLNKFISTIGTVELYFSYGIPIPRKIGKVNWIHVANVLPFVNAGKYVPFKRSLELKLLGLLMRNSMKYADVISAESEASLNLIKSNPIKNRYVSVNGNNEEIAAAQKQLNMPAVEAKNIAVAIGTCQYKSMDDVYKIYCHLRRLNPALNLVIAGIKEDVPRYIQDDKQVILKGVLTKLEISELLMHAKYYITATLIENSYNAASEGVYLAKEAFVSDIGPHRELLKNAKYQVIRDFDTRLPSLHVKREDLECKNLKSWDQVIQEMLDYFNRRLQLSA